MDVVLQFISNHAIKRLFKYLYHDLGMDISVYAYIYSAFWINVYVKLSKITIVNSQSKHVGTIYCTHTTNVNILSGLV